MPDTLTRTRDREDVLLDELIDTRARLAHALALAARWEQIARTPQPTRWTWADLRAITSRILGTAGFLALAALLLAGIAREVTG